MLFACPGSAKGEKIYENSHAQKLAHLPLAAEGHRMGNRDSGLPHFPSLLLVQSHKGTSRALQRLLAGYYGEILVADNPADAEQLLSAEGRAPTHLICGQYFDADAPRGQDLVCALRQKYPEIERAVLATGMDGVSEPMPGIDGVYEKPAPLSVLLHLLGVRVALRPLAQSRSLHQPQYPNGVSNENQYIHQVSQQEDPQGSIEPVRQAGQPGR
jgi:hypothetical protein